MAVVFGEAFWPGAEGFISCSYTVSHGISPGVATLVVPWQDSTRFDKIGTLTMRDGIRDPVLLRRCLLQSASVVNVSGGKALALTILDRRWELKFGWIDGEWNIIDQYPDTEGLPQGDVVNAGGGGNEQEIQVDWGPFIPGTEKAADELMALCLDAMNVGEWDIKNSPNAFPSVNWYGTNPAGALQAIADPLGLRVIYRVCEDKFLVDRIGETRGVPTDWPIIEDHPGLAVPAAPNTALAFSGPSWFADFLPLEPVGMEHNGEFIPIEQLSYYPAMGWAFSNPGRYSYFHFNDASGGSKGNCETVQQAADLANRYIYKAFRIKADADNPIELDDFPIDLGGPIEHRRRIVLAGQVYTPEKDISGQFRTKAGWSSANSYARHLIRGELGNHTPRARIDTAFSVDPARGLVLYSEPIYRAKSFYPDTWEIEAPELKVYTSFRIRSVDDNSLIGTSRSRTFSTDGGELPETLYHPELVTIWQADRSSVSQELQNMLTNEADVLDGLDYFLEKSREKYEVGQSTTRTYAGIFPIDPDGGVQQVTWTLGSGQPATTTVSINSEHAHWLPPFAQRRRFEKLDRFG